DGERAAAALDARARDRVVTGVAPDTAQSVAFLFPGLGSHYAGMGRGLYETEPVFRETVDRCAEILRPHLGLDIRDVLYPADLPPEQEEEEAATTIDLRAMLGRAAEEERDPGEGLNATKMAQPALFVTEYALAQLWMSWGVRPAAMIGHSLGEYVAATIAGVWSLEDGLRLAAERARLIEAQPPGGMMGVVLPEEEARGLLRDGLCIGALNGPQISVLSGPAAVLDALQAEVAARGMVHRRLPVRHAFHSTMMEPVAEGLAALLRGIQLHAPRIPFASNVTGDWIRDEEATDPTYWTRHLCGTVRFSEGITALAAGGTRVLLEVGPGHALRMLSAQLPVWGDTHPTFVASLRHGYERHPDVAHVLGAAGRLWAAGAPVDWEAVHAHERLRRVPVPAYPFERMRYWIERRAGTALNVRGGDPLARRENPADWLYVPTWNRAPLPAPAASAEEAESWLVLADAAGVGTRLAARLRARGHTVVLARAGEGFGPDGDGWTVRPGSADDLQRLRDELDGQGIRPRRVVQLWGVDADGPDALDRADAADAADAFARAHARGYATVAAVARVFAGERTDGPFRLLVATEGVRDVSGSEGVRPERATVLGACLALPHEHPHARCGTVDVRWIPGGEDALAEQLLAEAVVQGMDGADGAEGSVALRGRLRYARGWQAVRAPEASASRPGGAWLFAGLPRAGDDVLVEHLAQSPGARIAVVADPGFPEPDAWDARLSSAPGDDPVAMIIRGLRAAEARGARTLLLRANPEDAAALRGAVEAARDAFGGLNGVVYTQRLTAGAEHASLAEAAPGDVGAALGRVAGDLAALEAATAGIGLDAVLLQNSNLSVFGGPRLAAPTAAGLLMAAWAARQAARGGAPWTSVDWDRWLPEEDETAPRTPFTERAIVGGEGARVFAHAAALAGEPRVVVSTHDLEARIAQLRAPRGAPARTEEAGDGAQHPRPELRSEYHPPTNPAEEVLVEFWRELTGIREIGIRDDFFALGGNSLLGMQLLARVRDAFEVDLPLRAVFEAPTVAALAVLIDEAIILELEAMDEDEALVLAGGTAA
ncbi:MAG TPA: acyltransferase domain-containing protein, partial [Longimicrobium sp.]|nr:acyltransferase domain-containing protein [Longimicrobium sp.]